MKSITTVEEDYDIDMSNTADLYLKEKEDVKYTDKVKFFLDMKCGDKTNFIRDTRMSNDWILKIYSELSPDQRRDVLVYQHLTRETFEKLPKEKFDWESFSQLQNIVIHEKGFAREYADFLDWEAISRRHDLTFDFIREFREKINWDKLVQWNTMFRGMDLNEKFRKEFKDEIKKCEQYDMK